VTSDAPTSDAPIMPIVSWLDVVLLVVATPIVLLMGVPAVAYCAAAGAWVLLRVVELLVERYANTTPDAQRQIATRMGFMFVRLFGLALLVIVLRKTDGRDAGLTALVVAIVAYTLHLLTAPLGRPRNRIPTFGRSR
jgi:VanZ family protein